MQNIIFDFGGVLMDWSPDYVYTKHFQDDLAMHRFYEDTQILKLNRDMDRGLPFDHALAPLHQKFPHYSVPLRLWKTDWHKMIAGEIKGTTKILYELKSKGYRLFGLTNWAAETFPFVYYTYDFFKEFEDIIVSGREGVIKPDPAIYRLLLRRNKLNPEESIFIDDNHDNILAAEALGIRSILFENPQKLRKSLEELNIFST